MILWGWQSVSDYISIKDDRLWQILFDEACVEGKQAERIQKELEQIALDEKEILRKPFERVVERLEEKRNYQGCIYESDYFDGLEEAIEIVKEEGGIE